MSVNNGDQGNIWPASVNNVKPSFSGNQEEQTGESSNFTEKEVTRESLYDMNALAGQTQIKSKKTAFKGNQALENKNAGITITQDRLTTVTNDMKPFLKSRPAEVMRATALGDFAFGSAVKEQLTAPYAKAALIQFAAAQEFAAAENN